MIISIREANAWEQERWTYVFDLSKQNAEAIHWLMIFIRVANKYYEECKENAPEPMRLPFPFGGRSPKLFAASFYSFDFWDGFEDADNGFYLFQGKSKMCFSKEGSYKSNSVCLDAIISVAKMKSSAVTMRDKDNNKLYKNFEHIFLKQKAQPLTIVK
jgi:hypothetical protein